MLYLAIIVIDSAFAGGSTFFTYVCEESSHGRGCTFCAKKSLSAIEFFMWGTAGQWSILTSTLYFGLRHRSFIGYYCERMHSKSFWGWVIEFLMWGAQRRSAATLSWNGSEMFFWMTRAPHLNPQGSEISDLFFARFSRCTPPGSDARHGIFSKIRCSNGALLN